MTQDQCLDNGHQATSNNHFTNDQVSDDLNNSINNIVSNGVNSVQEFNVDVNSKRSENRADVAIVQNRTLDDDSRPSGKVLKASEQLACTSKYIASPKEFLSNCVIAIDENKRESANNILLTDMTVITHQNSSENIREIIANSNQINKDPSDSQITEVVNNVNSDQNIINASGVHNSGETRNKLKIECSVNGEIDKPEDPVERLNKLRASISNALSEVKGVLKQYSTEQSIDGESESAPSSHEATDDGPVRFRFVRKIRRRSAYTEDDEDSQKPENVKEPAPKQENVSSCAENPFGNNPMDSSSKNESAISIGIEQKKSNEEASLSNELPAPKTPGETTEKKLPLETQQESTNVPPQANELSSNNVSEPIAESHTGISDNTSAAEQVNRITTKKTKHTHQKKQHSTEDIDESAAAIKIKSGKPKKIIKKNRRASIAAVEVNQVPADESIPNLELKTERRPSDSGTLVKQPSIGKHKSKTGEKVKVSHRQAKSIKKIESCETTGNNDKPTLSSVQPEQPIPVEIEDSTLQKTERNQHKDVPLINTENTLIESHGSSPIKTPEEDCVLAKKPTTHQLKTESLVKTDVPFIIDPNCVPIQEYKNIVSSDKLSTASISKTPVADTIGPTQDHVETATSIKAKINSFQDEQNQRIDNTASLDSSYKSTVDKTAMYNTITCGQDLPKTTPIIEIEAPIIITQSKIEPNSTTKQLPSLDKSDESTHDTIESTQNQDETANLLKTKVPTMAPDLTSEVNETTRVSELATTINKITVRDEVTKDQVTVPFNITEVPNAVELSIETVSLDKSHELTKSISPPVSTSKTAPQFTKNSKQSSSIPKNTSATGSNELVAIDFPKAKANNSRVLNKSKNNKIVKLPVHKLPVVDHVKSMTEKSLASDQTQNASDKNNKIVKLPVHKLPEVDHVKSMAEKSLASDPTQVVSDKNNKIVKLPDHKLPEVDHAESIAEKSLASDPTQNASDSDAIAPESSSEDQTPVEENNSVSASEVVLDIEPAPPKKKKKAKRKVVIRRIKRKLSKDDTFIQTQEAPPVLEIEEKEIEENDDDEEEPEIASKQRKSCLKARQFEIGDVVMYAERYRKTQVKWKKGTVIERITSISYKLDIDGEEKPAHISYIKKFTNRKVNFGGKEYLEIDYAQIEEDEEKERNYSIWNLV